MRMRYRNSSIFNSRVCCPSGRDGRSRRLPVRNASKSTGLQYRDTRPSLSSCQSRPSNPAAVSLAKWPRVVAEMAVDPRRERVESLANVAVPSARSILTAAGRASIAARPTRRARRPRPLSRRRFSRTPQDLYVVGRRERCERANCAGVGPPLDTDPDDRTLLAHADE